jgi:hypothetical protein
MLNGMETGKFLIGSTGCGKLTAFFKGKMQYEKRSELAAPCIQFFVFYLD